MAIKKAQTGKKVPNSVTKKNIKDATEMKNMRPVFKGPNVPRAKTTLGDGKGNIAKAGKTIKKAKTGTSLGMKSVKAGVDKNPGVTRADIIAAATKQAKKGAKIKKAFLGSMLKDVGKSVLGGLAGQALGGLMGGGGASRGGAAASGGASSMGQNPTPRKSTDTTPVKTRGMMKKGGKVSTMKSGGTMKTCRYGCK